MTNFSDTPNPADTESPMFAAVPAWERNKKRGMFGRSAPRSSATEASIAAAEERSFAPVDPVTPRLDPMPVESESAFAATPTYADRTSIKRNNTAPLILGAGIVLIGGLAAAGWYASQPHNAGVAELTPGVPAATTTTTTTSAAPDVTPTPTPTPPPAAPSQLAINTAPPAPPAPAKTVARAHASTTTMARRAPAPTSRSVQDSGVNAAAQAPATATAPAPAAAPVLTPAPTQSAAPPADTSTPAPAPTPAPEPTETPH